MRRAIFVFASNHRASSRRESRATAIGAAGEIFEGSDNYKEMVRRVRNERVIGRNRAMPLPGEPGRPADKEVENLCQRLVMPRIYGFDYRRVRARARTVR